MSALDDSEAMKQLEGAPGHGPDAFVEPRRATVTSSAAARGIWATSDLLAWPAASAGHGPTRHEGQRGVVDCGHHGAEHRTEDDVRRISFLRPTRLRVDPVLADAPPSLEGSLAAAPGWLEGR